MAKGVRTINIKASCAAQYGRIPLCTTTASPQYSLVMARPSRAPRRHSRRNSSQRHVPPTAPDAQTAPSRRRNLYGPPMSVTCRQIQIRNWRDELRDLTENLAQVQERIQQLETIEPESIWDDNEDDTQPASCQIIPPRSSSIPYRLPELGFDSAKDNFQLHIDDWLNASPPEVPTSADVAPSPAAEDVQVQSSYPAQPNSSALEGSTVAHRRSHQREKSATTTSSFESYNTESVQVHEASTAAVTRPCVRSIESIRAASSGMAIRNGSRDRPTKQLPKNVDKENRPPGPGQQNRTSTPGLDNRPPTPGLFPAPLFSDRKFQRHPRKTSHMSRPSSDTVSSQGLQPSQHSISSSGLASATYDRGHVRQRPTSGVTVIQRSRALSPSSAVSSMHTGQMDVSDGTPCFTTSEAGSPRPSTLDTRGRDQLSTPMSFRQPPWLHSSPPPSDVPQMDYTSMSVSDPATPTPAGAERSPRLRLFPKIRQTSSESLARESESKDSYDPFYSVCPDQAGCVEPTPTLAPIQMADPYVHPDSTQQDTYLASLDQPKGDAEAHRGLVRSPRRKLRSFLRKITPTTNKARHSLPSGPTRDTQALTRHNHRVVTPPRLPTRRGSTLPFDQALLGELTKISDRPTSPQKGAPSPARRIRNSMHDAAGLSLGRTAAATHRHWRAQRSRSSILSPVAPRSRAPTGSTFNTSFSSGPSFYFLPKVDQIGTPSNRRGSAMRRQRKSRY